MKNTSQYEKKNSYKDSISQKVLSPFPYLYQCLELFFFVLVIIIFWNISFIYAIIIFQDIRRDLRNDRSRNVDPHSKGLCLGKIYNLLLKSFRYLAFYVLKQSINFKCFFRKYCLKKCWIKDCGLFCYRKYEISQLCIVQIYWHSM